MSDTSRLSALPGVALARPPAATSAPLSTGGNDTVVFVVLSVDIFVRHVTRCTLVCDVIPFGIRSIRAVDRFSIRPAVHLNA
jgi:hypothetical protein